VYNSAGLLQSATDYNVTQNTTATDSYVYDAAGEVTSDSQSIPGLTPVVTLSEQYAAGNRTRLAASIGGVNDFVNNYQYNSPLGQMSQVTQTVNGSDGKTATFAYNNVGQFLSVGRYQNSTATNLVATSTYGYDSAGELTYIDYADGQSTPATLDNFTWTYDAAGDVSASSSTLDGTVSYASDSTGQLTSDGQTGQSYVHDPNGNRETVTTSGGTVTSITGTNNEVLFDGTYNYQYDGEGNRIARWVSANGSGEAQPGPNDTDITIYGWDNRNRMTSATSYANYDAYKGVGAYSSVTPTQAVVYSYDAFDRWIGETVTAAVSGVTQVQQEAFVYDGTQIIMQFSQSATGTASPMTAANLSHRYLWGPAVDQLMADEQIGGASAGVHWALTDNLNTVRDLATYNAGTTTIAADIVFSAYGQELSATNQSITCLFGFTGRPTDNMTIIVGLQTGLQSNWHRWYDSITACWTNPDPDGFSAGDANLYRYCGNDPTNATDPVGNAPLAAFPAPGPYTAVGKQALAALGGTPSNVTGIGNAQKILDNAYDAAMNGPPASRPVLPGSDTDNNWAMQGGPGSVAVKLNFPLTNGGYDIVTFVVVKPTWVDLTNRPPVKPVTDPNADKPLPNTFWYDKPAWLKEPATQGTKPCPDSHGR
jgi:RHS repeat-associated protein